MSSSCKKRVSYCFNREFPSISYGDNHVMQPERIQKVNALVVAYKLQDHMKIIKPKPASYEDLTAWHAGDYIDILRDFTPESTNLTDELLDEHNLSSRDCPLFTDVYKFSSISCGASLEAAQQLTSGSSDICINWMGGLHHAFSDFASGFCYANDAVLAILKLLKTFQRVLYVDIDVHHGDGVEKAFEESNRVMTCSFHQYGENFFPKSGNYDEIGKNEGKHYAVNVPLKSGVDNQSYRNIFKPIMTKIMECFAPNVVVLQCGADSLSGDKLGSFSLSTKAHGECVEFFLNKNIPLMLLGGGGYTMSNVARCWTYETSLAVGKVLDDRKIMPFNYFNDIYEPSFKLHVKSVPKANKNTPEYLSTVRINVLESLRHVEHVPSVQMHPTSNTNIFEELNQIELENVDANERLSEVLIDHTVVDAGELYDNEKEGGDLRNIQSFEYGETVKRPIEDCAENEEVAAKRKPQILLTLREIKRERL